MKITTESAKPPGVQKPVLEIIVTIHARERKTESNIELVDMYGEEEQSILERQLSLSTDDEPREKYSIFRASIDSVEIFKIGKMRIVIYSPQLLNVLRRTVDYYPLQNLTGDRIIIMEPYMCLIHYYDALKKAALPCEGGILDQQCKLHSHMSLCDEETKKHVQILLDFLAPTMENIIVPARKRLERDSPMVTFDTVWLLFQPGTEIYADFMQQKSSPGAGFEMASVVYKAEYKTEKDHTDYLVIYSWFMSSDGEMVGRSVSTNWIVRFEGEKEVAQLQVRPVSYFDPSLRACFISWGKIAHDLFKNRNKAIFFDGRAYSKKTARKVYAFTITSDEYSNPFKYRGEAIIDPISTIKYNVMEDMIYWHPTPDDIDDRSPHLVELGGNSNKYSDYESLSVAFELTDHQCFLMYPFIGGFGLVDKEWKAFHIAGVQAARYDKIALDKLVLDSSDLNIIKAISHRQAFGHGPPTLDFIEGKGQGQVILLHGPPGVGKTYIVESVATYFGRPLLSLSIADVGTNEELVEKSLSRWLNLAETWNAVLLIDEADVFLEKRSKNKLERNGLVSVFLRKIKYFQDLLFLTTNRIGQIDDAFSSCIHAKIQYPKLSNEKCSKIWELFFEKLKSNSGTRIYISKTAKDYVLQSTEIMDRVRIVSLRVSRESREPGQKAGKEDRIL